MDNERISSGKFEIGRPCHITSNIEANTVMSAKESLKSIRACLDSKDFEQAAGKAKDLCDKDPQNYHAYVDGELLARSACTNRPISRYLFLGLALDNLNDFRGAETSYLTATAIKDDDRTAWQGLLTLYEKQDGKYLDQYRKAVTRLCQILAAT